MHAWPVGIGKEITGFYLAIGLQARVFYERIVNEAFPDFTITYPEGLHNKTFYLRILNPKIKNNFQFQEQHAALDHCPSSGYEQEKMRWSWSLVMSHYTMLYTYGKRVIDLFLRVFILVTVFYLLGAIFVNQLFYSRLLERDDCSQLGTARLIDHLPSHPTLARGILVKQKTNRKPIRFADFQQEHSWLATKKRYNV